MAAANSKADVVRLFFEVGGILKQYMRRNFEALDITMPQSMVIHTLIESGELKITELSSKINLSSSTISGIVDRLEKQQLVVRTRSEEDRRSVYVKVTPKVQEIFSENFKNIEKNFEELLSPSTPEDIAKIFEGLNVLKRILKNESV